MRIKRIVYAAFLPVITALCLTSCGVKEQAAAVRTPGTILDDVYLGADGGFTVKADEARWMADAERSGGESALYLKDSRNVWISFSRTDGITAQMITSFRESFVKGYIEGLAAYYPDVKEEDCRVLNDNLARLDMLMTSDTGSYKMYQILYLATDGNNGYIITSTLRAEEAEEIKPLIYEVVESIEFD